MRPKLVTEQELFVAYESCKQFHPISYECDITIKCDHKNITYAEMQYANLCVHCQIITLDQVYQAKLEHFASTSNTGADNHSRLHMQGSISDTLMKEVFTTDELDCTSNLDFPISMDTLRKEQDLDNHLQSLIKSKIQGHHHHYHG